MGRYINVMSVATTQFSGMPDPLPPVSTSYDFGEQHQVQTGSTDNLTMETEWNGNAISMAIPMFLGASFSLVYMQPHPMLPLPRNSKMADVYRK